MHDQDSYWEEKLARPPFPRRRFTQEMMTNVENHLQHPSNTRKRTSGHLIWTTVIILALGVMIFVPGLLSAINLGTPAAPQQEVVVPPLPIQLELQAGEGGDITVWEDLDTSAYREADQTLIEFIRALMRRGELGAMGGPSVAADRLWEDPEDKRVLAIYEVSSPWIAEVHLEQVEVLDDAVSYTLMLTLTDSTQSEYQEPLQVDISLESHLIRNVMISTEDEDAADEEQLLAEDASSGVSIQGFIDRDAYMIQGISVSYGEQTKPFDHWTNTANESFYPTLWVTDITGDGVEDIAVALTTGHGTGYHEAEMKILDGNHLEEIPVPDPIPVAESMVESILERDDTSRTYRMLLNGDERTFTYDESDAGMWFDTPVFGNVLHYRVEDNVIYADVSVQVSPGHFPVDVTIRYDYADGTLTTGEAGFTDM